MTGITAYTLAKNIALGAVSGLNGIELNGNTLIFKFKDGTSSSMTIPLPKDGASAYEIAVRNGFVGTEQEWTDSLKSDEPGPQGFSPLVTISTIDKGHKVTITDINGEKSFDVMDGNDSGVDLTKFYTKQEVNNLIENLQSEMETKISQMQQETNAHIAESTTKLSTF